LFFLLLLTFDRSNAQDSLSKEQLVSDLYYYRDNFSSKHKDPFTKLNKAAFENQIAKVAQRETITTNELTIELLKLNAAIGDEHSGISPAYKTIFPLEFEMFDEGMVITRTNSRYGRFLNYRIIGIDDFPFDSIVRKFELIINHDNPNYFNFFLGYLLNKPALLKGLGIISNEEKATFMLVNANRDTSLLELAPVPRSAKIQWYSPVQNKTVLAYQETSNYWFRYDSSKNVLYFNFMQCSERKDLPFAQFNQQLFETIRTKKPDKLILDLRFNSGGSSAVLQPFIDSIKHSYLNRENHFFVLIGKKVFSSALMNAVDLKRNTKAILVGQPTGGNINHFGEVRNFQLPNTKMMVTYSTKYWETWKHHDGPLMPDIRTSNSYFDYIKGVDKTVQTAMF
jgi:hypothetical protein